MAGWLADWRPALLTWWRDGLCETKRWPKQHSEVRRTRETHLKREYGYLHPHRLGAVLNSRPPIRSRWSRELGSLQEPNKKKPGHVLPKKWRAKDGEDEEEVDWAVERGRSGRAVGRFGFGGNEWGPVQRAPSPGSADPELLGAFLRIHRASQNTVFYTTHAPMVTVCAVAAICG
ncbi:hypothetical protein NEUTE1DRAFT_37451 [Neurospora tetrasperma FGSC 2508]|uniref:Uncharacterized protein n=1 Tax=Neurospora tetrasperma (strain FGSC 2508 / ATCC MYA-4615 / P0657) TaxID=510951 RepID=F8MBC1_NEUT8|nr:uncharacterized protein NEUTE1DRAFT_37451 [Neurospora tetrasperma FGSC 2508]EGO61086.1 hypothetical protein NEUTE1DRAFT_37451 [Neurospora tetrasperma FGSC 2508]EGZ74909.1 hypothetical protein NEUTE2DRAFT_125853 [Neurospora tetrasperma FGSC 2509]